MRNLGWVGAFVAASMALAMYAGTPISGQAQQEIKYSTPPPLVITAFGGKPVDYKAPRTPWGDPDLQGVWSSDDMQGVGIAGGGGRGGGGGGGRGARGGPPPAGAAAPAAAAPAAPAGPPPLYRTDEETAARAKQIQTSAARSDGSQTDGSFRFDYARRAF